VLADAGTITRCGGYLFQQGGRELNRAAPAGRLRRAGFTLDFHGAPVGLAAQGAAGGVDGAICGCGVHGKGV
jgi:hypothetical protein